MTESGQQLSPPADWAFLPAGDAAITREVKAKVATWVVQVRRGKREISLGIWAEAAQIEASSRNVEARRATPEYAHTRQQLLDRRQARQAAYVEAFTAELVGFLAFHPRYEVQARRLSELISRHATPVGSGTVARTERIPLARRVEAAAIAWMRHQTTTYDTMKIPRIQGRRRDVRRRLAAQSLELLHPYRQGWDIPGNCPLKKALEESFANQPAR